MIEVVKEVLSRYLLDFNGLYALLALIPLIIIYLIRPRPKKKTVPALMFLMKEQSKWDKSSFLRKILRDPLLFFQIILILLFAATLAKPFMTVNQEVLIDKTAIVIDASASMQVRVDGVSRFEKAIDIAKENTASSNAIITVGAVPELVADDVDASKARDIIDDIKVKDTPTDLFDSIIFAGNFVKPKDRVVVISDFIETASTKDFNAAKNILKSKGIEVEFLPVPKDDALNIGIIELDVGEDRTSVQIKNYNQEEEPIDLKMEGANLSAKSVTLDPNGIEVVSFDTPGMLSKFTIGMRDGHDDFSLDNEVYISSPSKAQIPILVISNDPTKYLKTALEVIPNLKVEYNTPPMSIDFAHNIIMLSNVKTDLMLPGVMKAIKKEVKDGAALIVVGQPNMFDMDFQGILPVRRADNTKPPIISKDGYVRTEIVTDLTEDVNFGHVEKYLNAAPVEGTSVLATVAGNVTMIAVKNYGEGTVIYVGMMDDYSDFRMDVFYPIFWKRLFDMALKKQDLNLLNYHTGDIAHLLSRQKVQTPAGKVNEEEILLDYQGIYRSDERNFVANLVSEKESMINGDEEDLKGVFDESLAKSKEAPFELGEYFLWGLLFFVFLELLWVKMRGDL